MNGKDRLQAWTLMDELVLDVYGMARKNPADGAGDLLAAMRDLSVRAALRIVQGVHGPPESFHGSLRSALGTLSELRYYLYLAKRLGLIDLRRYRLTCARHERVQRCLRELCEREPGARRPAPSREDVVKTSVDASFEDPQEVS